MKKTAAVFLALLMLLTMTFPMSACAVVVSLEDGLAINPGNTRNNNPVYNFAWLDQLFVRTDASAVVPAELTPTPSDYPYEITYDEFVEECDRYIDLYSLDANSFDNIYSVLIEAVYYTVVAAGTTADFDGMCTTLSRNGILLPDEATKEDMMKIAIVYAAIEYNAIYAIYNKEVELPAGISLDAALTIILGELTGVHVPSDVETVSGLGVQAVKQYLGDYNYIPLSKNPTTDELFYFLKVVIITENEETVPLTPYNKVTAADKEYIDYTYFATVLGMAYDIPLDAEALYGAVNSDSPLAVHRLVLETMLNEKGVKYSDSYSVEKLFNLACKNGYFALEKEFFSDVLTYKLEVAPSCEKIWFTPITIGDQLNGGNQAPLTLYLQGVSVAPGSTTAAPLDTSKTEEVIYLEVNYSDAEKKDNALYEFTIIKNPALENTSSNTGAVGQVQDFVNSMIPEDNEKASEIVSGIFEGVTSPSAQSDAADYMQDILSTYADTVSSAIGSSSDSGTTYYNADYLGQLLENIYETDANGNVITTKTYTVSADEESTQDVGFLQQVTQTVAENPEIVAAPTSLLALGGLLGFMMNKRHKDTLRLDDESEDETEE
ncbi:MAG: hypothetical protein IKV21_00160 [Clostridia bacterium]|nr:hypothetical protein [Clostridia bacterium]